MIEFNFGDGLEDSAELKKLGADVIDDPDNFEGWEKLVQAVQSLEGGLTRNSSAQSISSYREVYDRFLAKFPLFFGYWKKYADLEFSIAGTEAAELVYERGVASITNSVDLWTHYCTFKVETSHDPDVIRELFERGANSVGLDFLAHPFWDKYLEFEERLESYDHIFAILGRIIHIPMHQYARYFERFRQLAQSRPIAELCPSEIAAQFKAEIEMESSGNPKSDSEMEQAVRARVDAYHLDIFHRCQAETTKRWTYEQEIKRPYFHVTELDDTQLANWRKYLDFEEAEGDQSRIAFLYERCLVAAAYYDEFWLRYARWMSAQIGKTEEVRQIYQRASCLYAPIARPAVRLQWALFEEMNDRVDVAHAIYEAMLIAIPGNADTIIAWSNSCRRHGELDRASSLYEQYLASAECDDGTKAALASQWARMVWRVKGDAAPAREIFQNFLHSFSGSQSLWTSFLIFELEQPTAPESEQTQHERVKEAFEGARKKSTLSSGAIKEIAQIYMVYLLERGTKEAATEYMTLDREVNGPQSIQKTSIGSATGANSLEAAKSQTPAIISV